MKRLSTAASAVIGISVVAATGAFPATSALAASQPVPAVHTITVGSNPIDVVISARQSRGYVANDGSVSVLGLAAHKQLAEVGTGYQDQTAIGLVRCDTQAYITTFDLNVVKVLSTKSLKVTKSIKVGAGATDIVAARTRAGEDAYVTLLQSSGSVGAAAVVQTSSGKVIKTIKLPAGAQTAATTPDSKAVWVGSVESGDVWVINTSTQKVVKTIPVTQSGPVSSIAFNPSGTRAWVFGIGGMSVLNVATGKVLAFIPVTTIFPASPAPNAGPVALTRSGRYALAVDSTVPDNPARGTVAVISTRTLKVVESIPVGTEPTGLAIDYQRHTAYVTNYQDDTVSYFKIPR
jgi:YVTN family beta-propeller protein